MEPGITRRDRPRRTGRLPPRPPCREPPPHASSAHRAAAAAPSLAPSFQIQGSGAEPPHSAGRGAAPTRPHPSALQMDPSRPAAAGETRPRGYVTSARRTRGSGAAHRAPHGRRSPPTSLPAPPGRGESAAGPQLTARLTSAQRGAARHRLHTGRNVTGRPEPAPPALPLAAAT